MFGLTCPWEEQSWHTQILAAQCMGRVRRAAVRNAKAILSSQVFISVPVCEGDLFY